MARIARYGSEEVAIPEGATNEDVRATLVQFWPELANARMTENGDYLDFAVVGSQKGN